MSDTGYILRIANKNYSSWSLRPWLLMKERGIAFEERLTPFGDSHDPGQTSFDTPNGKVPCLLDGAIHVWDSLAIVEYLAERHSGVWPRDDAARAWARSAAAEMHSGFHALRQHCSMSVGVRVQLRAGNGPIAHDLRRLETLWCDGLKRFGGAFLADTAFSAVDAFFAPVAFRIRSYELSLNGPAAAYAARLLDLPGMREWEAAALREVWRDHAHEEETRAAGTIIEDLRVTAS